MNIKIIVFFLILPVKSSEHPRIALSPETIQQLSNPTLLQQAAATDPTIICKLLRQAHRALDLLDASFVPTTDDKPMLNPADPLFTVHQQKLQDFINRQLQRRFPPAQPPVPTPTAGKALVKTVCDHIFHKACLQLYVSTNHACPTCLTPLRKSRKKSDDYIYIPRANRKGRCAVCSQNIM